ncbi:GtrA family protein [Corynebacterium sp. CCM 9204]
MADYDDNTAPDTRDPRRTDPPTGSPGERLFVSSEEMAEEVAAGADEYTGPIPVVPASDGRDVKTQGVRFIISGGISAVVDIGLTWLFQMVFGLSPFASRNIGFIFGTITAYAINRRWTFQAAPSRARFIAVTVLYALTWVLNTQLYKYLFGFLVERDVPDLFSLVVAFVIAQGIATVVNFVVQRTVIFKVR